MESRLIDVHHGSTSESWIVVYEDGRVIYHFETDGPRIVRHGVESSDELIDMTGIDKLERSYGKNLVEQVNIALKELQNGNGVRT